MPIRFSDIAWPAARRYWLANARVPGCLLADPAGVTGGGNDEGVVRVDLLVENGTLARIETPGSAGKDRGVRVDLGGRQVWPTLIDIHTHLDKAHTVERNPNVDGTFHNARLAAAADRPNWTEAGFTPAHGFRSALRVRARGLGDPQSYRHLSGNTRAELVGTARNARTMARPGRPSGSVTVPDRSSARRVRRPGCFRRCAQRQVCSAASPDRPSATHGATLADIDALLDRLFALAATPRS